MFRPTDLSGINASLRKRWLHRRIYSADVAGMLPDLFRVSHRFRHSTRVTSFIKRLLLLA
jgi:hypothetical protein